MTGLSKETERRHPFDSSIYKTRQDIYRSGTVAITAVVDGPGGNVIITAPGHGYIVNDLITQAATTDYDGDFVVQVVDGDDYQIIETFVLTRTGTTEFRTALQGLVRYVGKALIGIADSVAEWQVKENIYTVAGVLTGVDFAQNSSTEDNSFIFTWNDRATFTYGA